MEPMFKLCPQCYSVAFVNQKDKSPFCRTHGPVVPISLEVAFKTLKENNRKLLEKLTNVEEKLAELEIRIGKMEEIHSSPLV